VLKSASELNETFRCGGEGCQPALHANNERPPDVRRSRIDLRAQVNRDLHLKFSDVALTSYAGLELFGRYLRTTGFDATVRTACAGTPGWGISARRPWYGC